MNEKCDICGRDIDDFYGECEDCGKFFCAEHNQNVKGICPDCRRGHENK